MGTKAKEEANGGTSTPTTAAVGARETIKEAEEEEDTRGNGRSTITTMAGKDAGPTRAAAVGGGVEEAGVTPTTTTVGTPFCSRAPSF